MSIGLPIITYGATGKALAQTACNMQDTNSIPAEAPEAFSDSNPDESHGWVQPLTDRLEQGESMLVLNGMCGSTPNIAYYLFEEGHDHVISSINLPMPVREPNSTSLNLQAITQQAISGGREGITCCQKRTP